MPSARLLWICRITKSTSATRCYQVPWERRSLIMSLGIVPRSIIPAGVKKIQAIWSFKRKRYPDGTLNKHKARLCAHGCMQQWGVSYWETYSPVVNMHATYTVCTQKSTDFVLSFPQADLDVDIWMELPMGIVIGSHESGIRVPWIRSQVKKEPVWLEAG